VERLRCVSALNGLAADVSLGDLQEVAEVVVCRMEREVMAIVVR
jgi:hypothetical protein